MVDCYNIFHGDYSVTTEEKCGNLQ
uniref:Uncharacterized protein n=1 Tax=Rhizophora mucronata TaxID=61149 RepID=A0A2P2PR39_RHIMU